MSFAAVARRPISGLALMVGAVLVLVVAGWSVSAPLANADSKEQSSDDADRKSGKGAKSDRLAKSLKARLLRPPTEVLKLKTPYPSFSKTRETAALAFAEQHVAELLPVLRSLKVMDNAQYQEVIRQIYAVSEKIAQNIERDADMGQIMLQDWRTGTLVDLCYAQLSAESTSALQERLRVLLKERYEIEREKLELTRKRLRERLEEVETQLAGLDHARDQAHEAAVDQLLESANRLRGEVSTSSKATSTSTASGKKEGK